MVSDIVISDVLTFALYVIIFLFTLHAAVIGYHWYSYVERKSIAHIVVFSYVGVGILIIASLATIVASYSLYAV